MSFGNKSVDVYVSNNSDAPSKRCVLELTVRKIGNAPVGRVTTAIIPGAPRCREWVVARDLF